LRRRFFYLCSAAAAKRKARGYASFKTMRTVLFIIAGKLDFSAFNPHAS
jgi:transposase